MEYLLKGIKGKIQRDKALAPHTWFKLGGPADILFEPADEEDLISFLKQYPTELPLFIMGRGSNILVSDKGFRGVVIRPGKAFSWIKATGSNSFEAGAFTNPSIISAYALENQLRGCEFFSHLPGTLGAAIKMNAGAFGQSTSGIVVSAILAKRNGEIIKYNKEECGFSYRNSNISNENIILSAALDCKSGKKEGIEALIKDQKEKRFASQPVTEKTAGSFFKNPAQGPAAKFIDECGLKGYNIGGAMVSEKHANFFVNTGKASSADMIRLKDHVQDAVYKKFGVKLEMEVKLLGEF